MKKTFNYIYILLIIIVGVLFLNRLVLLFSYNLDLGGLENYFAFLSLKVGSGNLYTNPEEYPFMVTQYPPLYLHMNHYFGKILNVFFDDMVRSIYVSGRILNLVFNVFTITLVYKFFRNKINVSFKKAAIPALILFTLFIEHAYAVRMDSLKMLLIVAFYIKGYDYFKKPTNKTLLFLIIVGFLSMIAKQDAAIHIGLLGLAFFIKGEFVKAFKFGVPIAALFLLFSFVTCGFSWEVFYLNYVVGISQGVDFVWAKMVYNWNPFAMFAQLILIISALVWSFMKRRNEMWMPILLFFLYLFASFNILKWGSNFNYYFEFQILILCLFSYWIYKSNSKVLVVVFYGCMVVFLFNNVWNKNLGLIQLSEERIHFDSYRNHSKIASDLNQILEKDGASEVIVFSRPLSLLMSDKIVLGTTANEYPEWQFPYLKTYPRRTYDYHLDCSEEYVKNIRFITWHEVDAFHIKLIREMFGTNENLKLVKTQQYGIYNFYQLSCSL